MPTPDPDPQDPMALAVRWLSAVLDSADTDTIGVANWWDRARAAVESAAAGADNYPRACSIAARKLQITTYRPTSSDELITVGVALDDPTAWAAWLDVCRRDAVYVVALCQVARRNRRAARQATTPTDDAQQEMPL